MKTTLDLFGQKEVEIDYHFSTEPNGYGHWNIVFQATIWHSKRNKSENVFKARTTDSEFIDQIKDMVIDGCSYEEKQSFIASKWLDYFTSYELVLNWAADKLEEYDNI